MGRAVAERMLAAALNVEQAVTSIAQIAELTATDATVRIPYAGGQHTVHELKARNVTLTADDYALIRRSLGGGKRGRARARELVPLQCPSCGCRLTHFEPAQRAPYFAPTLSNPEHRERCEQQATVPARLAVPSVVEPTPAEASDDAVMEVGLQDAGAAVRESAPAEVNEPEQEVSEPEQEVSEPAQYVIADTRSPARESSSWRARLGIAPAVPLEAAPPSERATALADARELLTEALNRRVRADSQVHFDGQRYTVVSANALHRHGDGQFVAVYGRICDAAWSEVSGRLTLMAAPRTVQVWATATVPRSVLGLRAGDPIAAPSLRKPVPFIAFGRLKKLASVCGIPVVRPECLVLLLPLEHATTTPPIPSLHTTSLRDLTDELDQLLSAPLSAQPAQYASAEAAIAQAYSSLADEPLATARLPDVAT